MMRKSLQLLALGVGLLGMGFSAEASEHSELKVLSPQLKEITYTDYDIRRFNEITEKMWEVSAPQSAGTQAVAPERMASCSSAFTGAFFGRNYDFPFSKAEECVIHVPAREGRHASLGVTTLGMMTMKEAGADFLKPGDDMEVLPYYTLDGVNDAGLIVSSNLVQIEHGHTTGTNPGGKRVAQIALVRVLLDNCASVKEAMELVREIDLFALPKLELHYHLADASGASCIIEVVDNKIVILENQPVMTNFHHYDLAQNGAYTKHAEGIGRCNILKAGLGAIQSVPDMAKLMSQVNFSNLVKPGNEPIWWDEFNAFPNPFRAEFPDSPEVFYQDDVKDFPQAKEARMKRFAMERETLSKALENWRSTGVIPTGVLAWVSIHSSIYDCQQKTLMLRVLEMDDKPYYFKLQ